MKSSEIPFMELSHLINGYRTEDILFGTLAELYFNVTYAGHYACKKTFSICRSNMDSIFLLMTTAGEGKLLYHEKQYRLTPGSVMLIDTRIHHEYYALEDGWTFKYLHFHGGMSESYYTYIYAHLGPVFQLPRSMYYDVESLLDAIILETEKRSISIMPLFRHIFTPF